MVLAKNCAKLRKNRQQTIINGQYFYLFAEKSDYSSIILAQTKEIHYFCFCIRKKESIKKLSYIVRVIAGVLLGIYLSLLVFTAAPFVQRWIAHEASALLSKELNTSVAIANVRLGLFNRVVVDDLLLMEPADFGEGMEGITPDTLLYATRVSAKLQLLPLMKGKVHISNAQLFGYDIRLRRLSTEHPYNFQFIVDYFATEDTGKPRKDLSINNVIIRNGKLSHDILSAPQKQQFDIAHLKLQDLKIRASFSMTSTDSIQTNVSQLGFIESRSGLTIDNLTFDADCHLDSTATGTKQVSATIRDLNLQLPATSIKVPMARLHLADARLDAADGRCDCVITPQDFSPFVPALAALQEPMNLSSEVNYDGQSLRIDDIDISSALLNCQSDVLISFNRDTNGGRDLGLSADVQQLSLPASGTQTLLNLLSAMDLLPAATAQQLASLGDLQLLGKAAYSKALSTADLTLNTSVGNALIKGTLQQHDRFEAQLTTEDIRLPELLQKASFPLDFISLTAEASGSIQRKEAKMALTANDLLFKNERIKQLAADIDVCPTRLDLNASVDDDHYGGNLQANILSDQPFRFEREAAEALQGRLSVNDFYVHLPERSATIDQVKVTVLNDDAGHHLSLNGDFIDASVNGRFNYSTLHKSFQEIVHRALPSLVAAPSFDAHNQDELRFSVRLHDTDSLLAFFNLPLSLPETAYAQGHLNAPQQAVVLNADFPHVIYGSHDLSSVSLIAEEHADSLKSFLTLKRWMKNDTNAEFTLLMEGSKDKLVTYASWEDFGATPFQGKVSAQALFHRDEDEQLNADIHLFPTEIAIADTVWNIRESDITLRNKTIDVHNLEITQMGRHLKLNGTVSPEPSDTLNIDLSGIDVAYVLSMVDFDAVYFGGIASGHAVAHNLFEQPQLEADLQVRDFTLNSGLLGQMHVKGGWGHVSPRAIDLDAYITEPTHQQTSHVEGFVSLEKDERRGLDLDIHARRINAYFINKFTSAFFTDLQGQTSGHARLYGPFQQLNLDGALAIDTFAVTIDVIGTRYHSANGDSIFMSPEGIRLRDVTIYDALHGTDSRQHSGSVSGDLRFKHFKNIRYAFDVTANDMLAYDTQDSDDQSFYGIVYGDGRLRLTGEPGQMNAEIQYTPTAGTMLTYNVASPEMLKDNAFITFTDSLKKRVASEQSDERELLRSDGEAMTIDHSAANRVEEESSDIHIDFDLNITPAATIRLLMDPRSGDDITLNGTANLTARFHNKSPFRMFGTYKVERGTYRMSFQDLIRKDFQFERSSAITFNGEPMKAELGLQAIHTVPSVSLNDLTGSSNFSASSVRVNCIMNIGGRAEHPNISFDFDIPNVNEDEKQMVRSLISTEEERNLQVIYLLGIGRFYSMGLADDQTNTAMKSLLSSTLSGQLNDVLSNAIGNRNWNIGTNLSTGTSGWSDMDVEGSLSGRLMNNRLLINGTFGYRDTPIANTNFIGDFDVKWLLTRSGNISLKAYSETNDRYFTKTALTTQGIGIQLRKDFNVFIDLFRRRKQ